MKINFKSLFFLGGKGNLQWQYLIGILLGVVIVLIMINYVYNFVGSDYGNSVFECNFFMKNVRGSPKYFGNGLDQVQDVFLSAIGEICPSASVDVFDDGLSEPANLVKNCYSQMGAGEDFFGANVEDESLCFYCGDFFVEEDVSNFGEKFSNVLNGSGYEVLWKNETSLMNLNFLTLSENNLPSNLVAGEEYIVLFYGYKPEVGFWKSGISRFLGNYVSSGLNYLISGKNTGGVAGVVLEPWSKNVNFQTDRNVTFSRNSVGVGCDRIIVSSSFDVE